MSRQDGVIVSIQVTILVISLPFCLRVAVLCSLRGIADKTRARKAVRYLRSLRQGW